MSWLAAAGKWVVKVLSWAWNNPAWAGLAALGGAALGRRIREASEAARLKNDRTNFERFMLEVYGALGAGLETLGVALGVSGAIGLLYTKTPSVVAEASRGFIDAGLDPAVQAGGSLAKAFERWGVDPTGALKRLWNFLF